MASIDMWKWNKLSELEKARYFASVGDSNTVRSMTLNGVLEILPEFEQRKIVAQAFTESANLRDKLASQGLYSKEEWEDSNLQEAGANFSRNRRAKAIEILWNPEGKSLKEQPQN